MSNKELRFKILQYGFFLFLTVFTLFPFVWIISSSFKDTTEILSSVPTLIPVKFTFANYVTAVNTSGIFRSLKNSLVLCVSVTLLTIFFASLASYAIGFLRIKGKDAFFKTMVSVQIIPLSLLIIPIFALFKMFGLLNTVTGLIIVYLSFTLPVAVILITGYFESIPKEIKESAVLEGASNWQIFSQISLPLVAPGIVSVGILTFVNCWQEIFFAVAFISDSDKATLPVTLTRFLSAHRADWGGLMATSVVIAIPAVILFLSIQKFLIDSLAGSVKG